MSRTVRVIDRLATLLVALVLLGVGAAALWWWSGRSSLPGTVDTASVDDVLAAAWWPAVTLVAGLVLVLLGLRWLLAHARRSTVDKLHLPGSGDAGRLEVAGSGIADAAAEAFADTLGVRSASGRVVDDRGQLVLRISATIESDADLTRLAERADVVAADLARALDRPDLRCSVELSTARLPALPLGR